MAIRLNTVWAKQDFLHNTTPGISWYLSVGNCCLLWNNRKGANINNSRQHFKIVFFFFMPPPFSVGGHIVSPLSVRTYVPSRPSVPYVTVLVSVQYLLKRLVYWIEILYTGI